MKRRLATADMPGMDSLLATLLFCLVFGPPFVVGIVVGWAVRGRKERRNDASVVGDHQRLDRLVEDIQYHAYEHMTLGDGTLAPIVVDLIRSSEKDRAQRSAIQQARHSQGEQKVPFISLTSMPAPDKVSRATYPPPVPYEPAPTAPSYAPPVTSSAPGTSHAAPTMPQPLAPSLPTHSPTLPTRAPVTEESR